MRMDEIARTLGLESLTPELREAGGADVTRAHASDLLSDVLANATSGGFLLTIQVHMNVVAVALHAGLAGVVFTSGMKPDEAVARKAVEEKLPLFSSREPTFDVAGKLYALGVRGRTDAVRGTSVRDGSAVTDRSGAAGDGSTARGSAIKDGGTPRGAAITDGRNAAGNKKADGSTHG